MSTFTAQDRIEALDSKMHDIILYLRDKHSIKLTLKQVFTIKNMLRNSDMSKAAVVSILNTVLN